MAWPLSSLGRRRSIFVEPTLGKGLKVSEGAINLHFGPDQTALLSVPGMQMQGERQKSRMMTSSSSRRMRSWAQQPIVSVFYPGRGCRPRLRSRDADGLESLPDFIALPP